MVSVTVKYASRPTVSVDFPAKHPAQVTVGDLKKAIHAKFPKVRLAVLHSAYSLLTSCFVSAHARTPTDHNPIPISGPGSQSKANRPRRGCYSARDLWHLRLRSRVEGQGPRTASLLANGVLARIRESRFENPRRACLIYVFRLDSSDRCSSSRSSTTCLTNMDTASSVF